MAQDPIKRKKLYDYLSSKGMTDLDYETFSQEYSTNEEKSSKLYSYLAENEMTDLDQESFNQEYFGDLKKKEASTSQPQGEDTESVTPEDGSSDSQQEEPEEGFWDNLGRQLRTGSSDLGAMIASVPESIYNLAALPQNAIAELTGIEGLKADADSFKDYVGVENKVLDYYQAEVKKLEKETDDYQRKKFGTNEDGTTNSEIFEKFQEGDYAAGFELLAGGVTRSAPVSLSMMAGGAAVGSAGRLAAVTTPAFMEDARQELKEDNPDMDNVELTIKSLGVAGAETVFESLGTGTIGRTYKEIIAKEGVEEGSKIFRAGLIDMYSKALKKFGAPAAMTGEGIEEVATQITQNMIKGKEDPFEGAADAFLLGIGGGFAHGAPMNAMQMTEKVKAGMNRRSVEKSVDASNYDNISQMFSRENTKDIDDQQISIAGNKHSRSVLESDLTDQVKEGLITEEEKSDRLQVFDQTYSFIKGTEGIELSDDQKIKAVNLLKERTDLEGKVEGKNKALFAKEHDRIAQIDEELMNIRNYKPDNNEGKQTVSGEGVSSGQEKSGEGAKEKGPDQSKPADVRGTETSSTENQNVDDTKPVDENKNEDPYKSDKPVKLKNSNTKKTVRENTGQRDTSEKVVTTKKKQLRDYFKTQATAARKGFKAARDKAKDDASAFGAYMDELVQTGQLTPAKSKGLIKKAAKLSTMSEKEQNDFFDQVGRTVAKANLKEDLSQIEKYKKRTKKRLKQYNRFGREAAEMSKLDIGRLPVEDIQEYGEVMQMLSRGKDIDWPRVHDLHYRVTAKAYDEQVEEAYQERINSEPVPEDKTVAVEKLDKSLADFGFDDSKYLPFEKNIIRKYLSIPPQFLKENLSKADLSKNARALDNLANGHLDSRVFQDAVNKYEATKLANEIKGKVGDKFIKPVRNMVDGIGKTFKKRSSYKVADYTKAIESVMVQHIDTVLKGIKGLSIYKELLHPITSQFNKAHEETATAEKQLTSRVNKARKSREGNRAKRLIPSIKEGLGMAQSSYHFDFNVLSQLYLRQKEYEAYGNKELAGKNIFSAKEHLEATRNGLEKTYYTQDSFDRIEQIFNEFAGSNGELDTKAIEDHFTKEEKEVIDFMRQELVNTKMRNMEINYHLRGENLNYPVAYFPRKGFGKQEKTDGIDVQATIEGNLLGSTSSKQSSSNRRTATKATALDFDTFGIFMNHVKESAIEYNLSEITKKTGMTLSQLRDSDNKSLGHLSSAIEKGIKEVLKAELGSSIYTPNSKVDQGFRYLVRRTFNRMLIDPIRLIMADVPSNYAPFYAAYADKIPAMAKAVKGLNKKYNDVPFINQLFTDFGSVHMSRVGGSRSVDYKESETSALSKQKYKQANPGFLDNFMDLAKKNRLTDWSDTAADLYYKIADAPAKQIWALKFNENFKKYAGEEFSTDKYMNDPEYKANFETQIKKAIKDADKSATTLFNTATKVEQKISVQAGRNDWKTRINSFMRSFTFNENRVFWDSFKSLYGKGTMDFGEALRTQVIVNTRSIGYAYAVQTMIGTLLQHLAPSMEDDEEMYQKAWDRAVAQHGMLTVMGNKGMVYNIAAAYAFEAAHEYIHNQDVEITGDAKYDPYGDSLLYAPQERGSLVSYMGNLGSEGYALSTLWSAIALTGEIMTKEEPITEEEFIKLKGIQIYIGLFSQATGMPIDRMGKVIQKAEEREQEWLK